MPGPAAVDPVAEVVVDVGLPHLDRPFEYLVPEPMSDAAVPGARVRVRFGGQDLDGFVVARRAEAEHVGRLAPLRRVVSPEPVLGPGLLALCRAVADRWAASLPDVVRQAVPPRHAQAEAQHADDPPAEVPSRPGPGAWARYPAGPAFLDRLAGGQAPRAAWTATPSADEPAGDWPAAFATAALTAAASGRGALMVLPDRRDVDRVEQALEGLAPAGSWVALTADLGPRARYAAWLRVARGQVRVVVGTRAAALAPVHDLGLVACWDDGDDLHAEPRAPYPHVRELLVLRAEASGAAALLGGFARTAEVQQLLDQGWAQPVEAPRSALRSAAPRVQLTGEGPEPERDPAAASARLPSLAWRTAKQALEVGPVLVQVPRRGYVPAVACRTCRTPARCPACHGPLALPDAGGAPVCRWCGRAAVDRSCPECGDRALRALVVGARRTAEELGRAFPGVPVRTSGGGSVLGHVPGAPALVVSTPGAEPVAEGGYAAALLLDAWALLDRADLRAGEEALRRWLGAAALVRGSGAGGQVVLVAPAGLPPVEALVRWDPGWHAARELALRRELGFPPAATVLTLTGDPEAVRSLRSVTPLEPLDGAGEALGPVPLPASGASGPGRGRPGPPADDEPAVRVLLRTDEGHAAQLVRAVRGGVAVRSARKAAGSVRVQRDPLDLV
ncbi:primosomal protein N' [Angustibacter aerolatus]